MDKELLIDCLYNKELIKQHLSQTRKAQNDILTKKPSSQFYHVQSSKYGVRQPVQIKNPLLIKSLFSSRKFSKEKDISLPICAFKILPTQTLASFQTDRIHSRCPAFKKLKLKLGLKQAKSVPDEQFRIETAPVQCRSQTSTKQSINTLLKSQPSYEKKTKKSEPAFTFNKNDWGIGGWNIIEENYDAKMFID
ncbi:unnamed protein product [Paramecium pentaurelia]|uniref:Uncharacterized protein n=1 Tax=Paramecium pentaurelia TaxID=43138 RepID=A0A8S1TQZ9_9CILI|nr:unnamed protein product [Paramecium pentaurelia]